jgi:hypothetical protein
LPGPMDKESLRLSLVNGLNQGKRT